MQVNEIFNSIDGEVNYYGQGMFTTFIRLQGCNLKCAYCDTKKAQDKKGGFSITPAELANRVRKEGYRKITITGGEPLLQRIEILKFLNLLPSGISVTVETNGSKSVSWHQYGPVYFVVDYKLPSSGMMHKMSKHAFKYLRGVDFIKFVIADERDFNNAFDFIIGRKQWQQSSPVPPTFAFSPLYEELDPVLLKKWVEESSLARLYRIALNVQLHKIIGLP